MLHWLLDTLFDLAGPLNVVKYITFRAAAAAITAFLLSLLLGPHVLTLLRRWGVREQAEKQPAEKLEAAARCKSGTPTMGGVLLCGALVLSGLAWCRFDNNPYTVTGIGLVIYFCVVGWLDDAIKLREEYHGLMAAVKLVLMTVGALGVGWLLYRYAIADGKHSHLALFVPFLKDASIPLTFAWGLPWLLWCWLVLAGAGNAVNITDGLDGLATGLVFMVAMTLALVCYLAGRHDFSSYLYIPHVAGVGEMAVLMASCAGASLGFLWFNCAPALVFMGDTGSLPLGGLLGFAALVCRQEAILLVAGGLFVVEAVSVILQVGGYKLTRRRLFPIAPIHHVPQVRGMPESRIVIRFWIIGAVLCMLALATLKIR